MERMIFTVPANSDFYEFLILPNDHNIQLWKMIKYKNNIFAKYHI